MPTIPNSEDKVTYFAETDARNQRRKFGIKESDRSKHMYVIGKTGMGKSTLLENMAVQDIWNGNGVAYIDPHGASTEKILEYIPEERVDDVLYFAPFDMEYPVGFNIMEDVDPDRRHLVVNGLMSTFEKLWQDAWSARMSYILQNTIQALLEYPGATLLDVNRMYTNKEFRKRVVENVTDPSVRSFWLDEYAKYTDRYTQEATPAIQNKVGQLAANPLIRNIVGQPESAFDVRTMMDERKILLVNLSKGKVGESNATLLGSMMINKIYLAAMSRADVSNQELKQLPNFYTFVDEFQSFANRSFADILSESRKYKLNLTMTHQYIEQMSEEVRAAVFGNVGTLVTFRVGAYDAEVLEKEFLPTFGAQDIVNLGFAQIYLRLMIDGIGSQPFSAQTLPPIEPPEITYTDTVIQHSRDQYATPRNTVENNIVQWLQPAEEKSQSGNQQEAKQDSGSGQNKEKKGPPKHDGAKQERSTSDDGKRRSPPKEKASADNSKHTDTKKQQGNGGEADRSQLRSALSQIIGGGTKEQDAGSPQSSANGDTHSNDQRESGKKKQDAHGGSGGQTPPAPDGEEGPSLAEAIQEAMNQGKQSGNGEHKQRSADSQQGTQQSQNAGERKHDTQHAKRHTSPATAVGGRRSSQQSHDNKKTEKTRTAGSESADHKAHSAQRDDRSAHTSRERDQQEARESRERVRQHAANAEEGAAKKEVPEEVLRRLLEIDEKP
jgi:hypothetical protein